MNQENLQEGVTLIFYCHARDKYDGMLLTEWLLSQARQHGIGGGSVFRAIAGYGRHGIVHEEQFFELADNLTVKVEFLLLETQVEPLLQRVRDADVELVYARSSTSFALLGKS